MQSKGPILRVGGHRVERLPRDDSHEFICVECAAHGDDLDDYRADHCDGAREIPA